MNMLDYVFPTDALLRRTVFAAAASVSSAINLDHTGGFRGLAVFVPNEWTPASIAFQTSINGSTWVNLRDSMGGLVSITNILTSEAGVYAAPSDVWSLGIFRYLRLSSVTILGNAAPQAAERVLHVALLK